ncbi:MAG: (4Fe-4S)-binding protein, partial [Solirubrobacteraceae bacterium]
MPDSMGPTTTRKQYHGNAVEVSFDGARCRHAAECLRGLPAVFDLARRPWILPDAADSDDVVSVVARCPTGALRTHPITSAAETPSRPTE